MINGEAIIDQFVNAPSDSNMDGLIRYAEERDLHDTEIVKLAVALAASGQEITHTGETYSDIPSTGGPSSLSTLICPLFLSLLGDKVIKLGVPGRPAGGIDVLSQIEGYQITPRVNEVVEWVKEGGYVHLLSSNTFAPLDIKLFDYRKRNNKLNLPAFVIASLLSKKICMNVKNVGLDIRVSDFGNFGRTRDDARRNATRFNRIANLLGIKSTCFITNGEEPQQPYIGRGESILALSRIFRNEMDPMLGKHVSYCLAMAQSTSLQKSSSDLSVKSLERVFNANVKVQGGSIESFLEIASETQTKHSHSIKASRTGILFIRLNKIRECLVKLQTRAGDQLFPDPAGIILTSIPYQFINKGDTICTFRCVAAYLGEFEQALHECFDIGMTVNETPDFAQVI